MRRSNQRHVVAGLLLAALLLVLAGCDLLGQSQAAPSAQANTAGQTQSPSAAPAAQPTAASPNAPTPAAAPSAEANLSVAVRDVSQTVKPAVVQITNQQTVRTGRFNQPYTVPAGVGSGVIYDNRGHILTNNHVVEGAQSLLVSLPDGRSFNAKLLGGDPQTDLAVVQITGNNLPVAQLGDSKKLQVGDWVVAIGNALALPGGPTVTAGVVSALGRSVQEPGSSPTQPGPYLFDVIQTDAPINPGNSGGPLVNLAGQVVGINTLVAGQAEPGVPAQGIGFAIAISSAKPVADQLVATGKVIHPYMGIYYQWLNPALAAELGISQTTGALIQQVAPGSPAAQAGIQPNDVITAVDGKALTSESSLQEAINAHKPGDTITLTIIRNKQEQTIKLTLAERPQGQ